MGMRYIDFVDLGYKPSEDDLLCDFYLEPRDMSLEEAAGGIAAESSIGTWTELSTVKPYMIDLKARVFKIEGNSIRIAYPLELFEPGNMPNILSSVAGNIFGLGSIEYLRLNDIFFPPQLLKSFKGPKYGIEGIRSLLRVRDRPLIGTIIKPKLGLRAEDHRRVAYEAWIGGCDIVKDDENLGSQGFNPFEDRIVQTLEARDRAESETGEKKIYMPNISSETNEMLRRAQLIIDQGGEYAMVDVLTCGFSALQTLRDQDFDLILHAHRAGHAAFTKHPRHGIAMKVVAKIIRIIGFDQLHVGAAVGKMSESKDEVLENCEALRGGMEGMKPALPVASGGLHPGLIPELIHIFDKEIVIQAGGGIHGHAEGTIAGARAMRQAVDAAMQGIPLEEYAQDHHELKLALEKWGRR